MPAQPNLAKNLWRKIGAPEFLFFFLAIWAFVVLLGGIGYGDLSGYDDAAYAHEAKTILQTNDWWTLHLNGAPDFDKPPLFIWLVAASFKIFGTNDFAAKLPGVLLGWATIVLTFFLAREIFDEDAEDSTKRNWLPALATLILATTQYFLKYASHAMTDVPFAFFFTLAVYFYARALKNNLFFLACGAGVGLATLTRSPMGLFPLAVIVLHLALTRRFKKLFSVHFAACVFLAALVPAIWYLREYNLFGDDFLTRHVANIFGHSSALAGRTDAQNFLWHFEYLFLLARLYEPWFPAACVGLFLAARECANDWRSDSQRASSAKSVSPEILLIVWVVVVLALFSFAEAKVLRYILPVFPAFSILSAYALCRFLAARHLTNLARLAVLLLTCAAIFTVARPQFLTRAGDMRALAPVSDAATDAPDEKVLLYTSGEWQANYQTQLLWYGNRLCVHLKDFGALENYLSEKRRAIVVMDKLSFADFSKRTAAKIEILGESENFACFRAER